MTAQPEDRRSTDAWSEAYDSDGEVRTLYEPLLAALDEVDIGALESDVAGWLDAAGVRFGSDRFSVCPIPRLLERDEWRALSAGLEQRARALSAFLTDAYTDREIVAAGIVPAAVIDGASGYEPELGDGRWPGTHAPLGVIGFDVVRDQTGELLVLEDNVRTPSGYSYAIAAREAVCAVLAREAPRALSVLPGLAPILEPVVGGLAATLGDAAAAVGAGDIEHGAIVVLTDGPSCAAFYEHAAAARWLDTPLVTAADLERRGEELWLRSGRHGPARPLAAVYRRTDEERLRDGNGEPTWVAELLLEPWLAGRLAIVNPFGAGVADDKLAHAYVEEMIRFYLGEEPVVRSVPTLDLGDPAMLEQVLDDLTSHVIKPRHGHGGHGVVVCEHAEPAELRRVESELREPDGGSGFIAQRTVPLSHHLTVVERELAERHIDLRPFAFATRDEVRIIPGGLTRVAGEAGSLVVNSSQDGGAKDTWVLP
jgi:carboxylate-amine ligase